jgi:hypothetical protein
MTLTRRIAVSVALAAPLAAAPALAQTRITEQHGLPGDGHTGVGAPTIASAIAHLTNGRAGAVAQRNDNGREMPRRSGASGTGARADSALT